MRHCLALDLKNDPALIADYERYHERVWPGIEQSILDAGVLSMDIYRVSNRLFMIMETGDSFSAEQKARMDADNPRVQAWETLMDQYQQRIPGTPPDQKWVPMTRIFTLSTH